MFYVRNKELNLWFANLTIMMHSKTISRGQIQIVCKRHNDNNISLVQHVNLHKTNKKTRSGSECVKEEQTNLDLVQTIKKNKKHVEHKRRRVFVSGAEDKKVQKLLI